MKKIYLTIIIIVILLSKNFALSRIAIIESDDYNHYQWGALEDILNDWYKGEINTNECMLYGCYVLAAQDTSETDISSKLLPSKYNPFKNSKEKGPYFFVNIMYNNENLLENNVLNKFHDSEWSDFSFIQEIINNKEFIKTILNSPVLKDENGTEYRDFCNVIKSAYYRKLIKPETIYFLGILPRINPQRYIQKFSPFWNQYKLKCISNCQDSLEDIISQIDPSVFNKNKKLIKIINFFWFNLRNNKQNNYQSIEQK